MWVFSCQTEINHLEHPNNTLATAQITLEMTEQQNSLTTSYISTNPQLELEKC